MQPEPTERIQRELRHGATDVAVRQAEHVWASAAGKIRRSRRGEFLVRGLPRTARILKFSAGTGLHTIALLDAFDDVVAIVISPVTNLAKCRAYYPGWDLTRTLDDIIEDVYRVAKVSLRSRPMETAKPRTMSHLGDLRQHVPGGDQDSSTAL